MPPTAIEPTGDIVDLLKQRTRNRWVRSMRFMNGSDRQYWLPRPADLPRILERARITHEGSQGDVFDCDDYAIAFKARLGYIALKTDLSNGLPIAGGIFWGRASWTPDPKHAGNWFLLRTGRLVWVEPQYNNVASIRARRRAVRPPSDNVTHLELMVF